jgi:hypothetical protein
MLEAFGPNIWIADGPTLKAAAGFHYPTRMAVIKLASGELLIWSPTALSDDLRRDIDTLGAVGYLAPPNSLHHTFLGEWQRAYPDAEIYAPPGLRAKRKDIRFAGDFSDRPIEAWSADIDLVIVRGNAITTEVVFFHRPSCTAILADLLQQFPPTWFRGWRAIVARLDLMVTPEPSVPRKFRVAFTDRRTARIALNSILAWPTQKVLVAHGQPIADGGQAFLARAFRWLGS